MENKLAVNSRGYLLLAGDILFFYISLAITLLIRYGKDFNVPYWNQHFWPFTAVLALLLTIFYIDQIYERTGVSPGQLISRLVRSCLIGGVLAISFFYIGYNRLFTIQPQRVLILQLGITAVFVYFWHLAVSKFAISGRLMSNVLMIGGGRIAEDVVSEIEKHPALGLQVKAFVKLNDASLTLPDVAVYDQLTNLKEICQRHGISIVVSSVHPREHPELLRQLFACRPLKIKFFDITSLYETITGKVPVKTIEQIWFLENMNERTRHAYSIMKRALDITCASLLMLATLPFWPIIMVSIHLSSPGPIFFTQQRVGKDRKIFTLIKFRTMVADAEHNGAQWSTKDDPRITKAGKFLRSSRIDEIPQLINVLKNEMSLIGPRPERPEFISQLQETIPYYTERLLAKPGLTGWAQVMGPAYGGSKEGSLEKLQYDLFYIKNRSFGLDVSIILKTIRTVISRRGQ